MKHDWFCGIAQGKIFTEFPIYQEITRDETVVLWVGKSSLIIDCKKYKILNLPEIINHQVGIRMKPIVFTNHAMIQISNRNTSEDQVRKAICEAPWLPAEKGRLTNAYTLPFNNEHWLFSCSKNDFWKIPFFFNLLAERSWSMTEKQCVTVFDSLPAMPEAGGGQALRLKVYNSFINKVINDSVDKVLCNLPQVSWFTIYWYVI